MSRISKLIAKTKNPVVFKEPKLFVPVDCQIPETPKTIMARTMLQSGLISKDDYDKMLGVEYDTRSENEEVFDPDDFEDWEDDYKVSAFSEYEEELEYGEEKSWAQSEPQEPIEQPEQSVEQSENADGTAAE